MAGLFAMSVNPSYIDPNTFLHDLYWGTLYQQNLGEDHCGLGVCRGGELRHDTSEGWFEPNFKARMEDFAGTEGVGYCGACQEPFYVDSKLGEMVLCFTGNIINRGELVKLLKMSGHTFERGDDIEVIAKLIAQGESVAAGIRHMAKKIVGAYTLLALTKEGIYASCSPNCHWPLVMGVKNGAVVVASESGGFDNLEFKVFEQVKPGETLLLKNGNWRSQEIIKSDRIQVCSFLWVYSLFPTAQINGIPASWVRKRLGAVLARRDIAAGFMPDVVTYIPDSGRSHALGYHQEFCRQNNEGKISRVPILEEVLSKFYFVGRSFTPRKKEKRRERADKKQQKSAERFRGLKLVVCDDSIVRGTQTSENIVPKIRSLGFEEIHLRISNPELKSHCPWGKTTTAGDLFAVQHSSIQEKVRILKVESLAHNTIEDLVEAIGMQREDLCIDCSLSRG